MNTLLQNDVEFEWDEKWKEAFQKLKVRLTEAPILGYPELRKRLYLFTDASGLGVGSVLAQKGDDG